MTLARVSLVLSVVAACPAKAPAGDALASASASASDSRTPDATTTATSDATTTATLDATTTTTATATATAPTADANATDKASGGALTIDESQAGKIIEVAKGQKLTVSLRWKPSSGYDWAVTKSPPALGTPDAAVVSAGDVPGAYGQRRFTFTSKDALPPGEHAVEFAYRRDFEKDKPPAKTFSFKVRAGPGGK
jgi:predicted secreted protein